MTDWGSILQFAQMITAEVGDQLLQDFGQVQTTEKDDGSLVTQADRWADRTLRTAIAAKFPDQGVLSEEGEHRFPGNDWCWIIDPLDGTTNFARGIPLWGISLGLLYRGTPVFGYVAIPPLRQTFHGYWYGDSGLTGPMGAFCGDRPIHPSSDSITANHFFSLCARSTAVLQRPFPCKIRMLGAATYNLLTVALGSTLGAVEATPKIWDIAAVWVIVQAAKAIWLPLQSEPLFPLYVGQDYSSQPYPTLVVSRPELVSVFLPRVEVVQTQHL